MMKTRLLSLMIATGAVALGIQSAGATTISVVSNDTTTLPATDFITDPYSDSGNFILSTTGSIPDVQASPWGNSTSAYSVLNSGGGPDPSTATYNMAADTTTFSFLWGSPDSYNTVDFYSGADGTGMLEGSYTGTSSGISPPATPGSGFDFVSFAATGGTIGSVELLDYSTAAFEYSDVSATPLPNALPLFVGGLGLMALLIRRKERKNSNALAA
jgi:hypothetical protein